MIQVEARENNATVRGLEPGRREGAIEAGAKNVGDVPAADECDDDEWMVSDAARYANRPSYCGRCFSKDWPPTILVFISRLPHRTKSGFIASRSNVLQLHIRHTSIIFLQDPLTFI